jgi:aryl-alcohol dehydrogenase-like predicted oxidoreductase
LTEHEVERRDLGSTGLRISVVGIGTAPIGSTRDWRIYWGRQDERAAVRAIQAAIDDGVNWVDTAPFYGWGRAEEIAGRAIRGRRDRVFVFTKCGTFRDPGGGDHMDLSPAAIRRDLEASLRRLGVDAVDLLQPHDVDPSVPIEDTWQTVHDLIREGAVRHGGLSNHDVDLMRRALAVGPVAAAQHQFNLLSRGIERDVLPFCLEHGIAALSWGSLAEGLLTEGFDVNDLEPDDFRRSRPNFREPRYSAIRALTADLSRIAAAGPGSAGRTSADLALAWLRSRPGMTGTIVGIRSEDEAHALARSAGWRPSRETLAEVDVAIARFDAAVAAR